MAFKGDRSRVLVVPGLHDSGPSHWQTWLAGHYRNAVRVIQSDWGRADVDAWADEVSRTLAQHGGDRWVAVAHSFGCLALARHLARGGGQVGAALMVAPADPEKFAVNDRLPQQRLDMPTVVVGSETDPWMSIDKARWWSRTWGAQFINLGDVGHINVESGFGPFPQAKTLTELLLQRQERRRRLERAHALELSFAI